MPRIFDNIEEDFLPALRESLRSSQRADFCVGYFNLRGWKEIDEHINRWSGSNESCCRLLVGMAPLPRDELRAYLGLADKGDQLDIQTAARLKKRLVEEFREQITIGVPTNEDEEGLRRLAAQIRNGQVRVKLYLRHPLHAKLYLFFRDDYNNPITGFLGSSNLTMSGLSSQGELNIDVTDADACQKLAQWFENRWTDRWCVDISDDLVRVIDESWAGDKLVPPYYVYLKIAYHLSQEARAGVSEFRLPKDLEEKLFEFQKKAVQIAAHHLNKRGGVLVADVVGLGKTLVACALARIFQEDYSLESLIICPKNLERMWQSYVESHRLIARVLPISMATKELPNMRRYRLVIVDESHLLRNRDTQAYRALREYIEANESKCVLLTATPYNKTYVDLSNQLRLFVDEDVDLGIRPERLIRELGGEVEFRRKHDCPVRSLAAFEKSSHPEDWQELMRLYMVRRTRSFIKKNYAEKDKANGRVYLRMPDGTKCYFPSRIPKTVKFSVNDNDPQDQYARLYHESVVSKIVSLGLARYGLGNYLLPNPKEPPNSEEQRIMEDLGRAGKRLMGFCRTNLFKRLESGGYTFLQSVSRHILRNYVFIYALDNNLDIPIGTLDVAEFDTRFKDSESEAENSDLGGWAPVLEEIPTSEEWYRAAAERTYQAYRGDRASRFRWLRASLFVPELRESLESDARVLLEILKQCGQWDPQKDAKLNELHRLLSATHPNEKVLIFTEFADTVDYLVKQLKSRGLERLEGVTGQSSDPTLVAWRFSPRSNDKLESMRGKDEIRVLIATDVLSDGQNLQDCAIVVNYDLPWAIVRLIQRVGRVDRIGQEAERILCYSFAPAEGVERIIRLRNRVIERLRENAEVVGTDEAFFEDDLAGPRLRDLFTEKAGLLEEEEDEDIDLASRAYQIWINACKQDPELEKIIPSMPNVTYATKPHSASETDPDGVLVYMRTAEGNDALARIDSEGNIVTQSQLEILKAAECAPDTPALPRHEKHHDLLAKAVDHLVTEEKQIGGQLGRSTGARFKTYDRLKRYLESVKNTNSYKPELEKAVDEIYRYPLTESARETLNRVLKTGANDDTLAEVVLSLREEGKLCLIHDEPEHREPQIICSMGLFSPQEVS